MSVNSTAKRNAGSTVYPSSLPPWVRRVCPSTPMQEPPLSQEASPRSPLPMGEEQGEG